MSYFKSLLNLFKKAPAPEPYTYSKFQSKEIEHSTPEEKDLFEELGEKTFEILKEKTATFESIDLLHFDQLDRFGTLIITTPENVRIAWWLSEGGIKSVYYPSDCCNDRARETDGVLFCSSCRRALKDRNWPEPCEPTWHDDKNSYMAQHRAYIEESMEHFDVDILTATIRASELEQVSYLLMEAYGKSLFGALMEDLDRLEAKK